MAGRYLLFSFCAFVCLSADGISQTPETSPPLTAPADSLLPPTSDWNLDQPAERLIHHSGCYAAGGVLVAPPIIFGGTTLNIHGAVLAPLPSPWGTIGFRRDNDVSWQTSFLLVPLYDANGFIFNHPYAISTVGLDVDRISTNHSA
jgi:hypothetical protein